MNRIPLNEIVPVRLRSTRIAATPVKQSSRIAHQTPDARETRKSHPLLQYLEGGGRRKLEALALRILTGTGRDEGNSIARNSQMDAAKDIVAEATMKAYNAWDRFDTSRPIHNWMVTITSRCAISAMGKTKSQNESRFVDSDIPDNESSSRNAIVPGANGIPLLTSSAARRQQSLREAQGGGVKVSRAEMEARCIAVVGQAEFDKLTHLLFDPQTTIRDEAKRLGCTERTVRNDINASREILKEALAPLVSLDEILDEADDEAKPRGKVSLSDLDEDFSIN